MKNQLTTVWGVVPGRQVGAITKRFHKSRTPTIAERDIMREFKITREAATRKLRYAQAFEATRREAEKALDHTVITVQREAVAAERETREANTAARNELARLARLAKYS